MLEYYVIALLLTSHIRPSVQHGFLSWPPQRSSLWRHGFESPVNYDDNALWCGGIAYFTQVGQRCGTCGDPFFGPHEHEAGGKYALGIIGARYPAGTGSIEVKVSLNAYHQGYFEFKICPQNNPLEAVTQECLDRYPLRIQEGNPDSNYLKYYPPKGGEIDLNLMLPKGLRCSQCVLQWRYKTGNSWGENINGDSCLGCGPQEEFQNCADISIGDDIPPDGPFDLTNTLSLSGIANQITKRPRRRYPMPLHLPSTLTMAPRTRFAISTQKSVIKSITTESPLKQHRINNNVMSFRKVPRTDVKLVINTKQGMTGIQQPSIFQSTSLNFVNQPLTPLPKHYVPVVNQDTTQIQRGNIQTRPKLSPSLRSENMSGEPAAVAYKMSVSKPGQIYPGNAIVFGRLSPSKVKNDSNIGSLAPGQRPTPNVKPLVFTRMSPEQSLKPFVHSKENQTLSKGRIAGNKALPHVQSDVNRFPNKLAHSRRLSALEIQNLKRNLQQLSMHRNPITVIQKNDVPLGSRRKTNPSSAKASIHNRPLLTKALLGSKDALTKVKSQPRVRLAPPTGRFSSFNSSLKKASRRPQTKQSAIQRKIGRFVWTNTEVRTTKVRNDPFIQRSVNNVKNAGPNVHIVTPLGKRNKDTQNLVNSQHRPNSHNGDHVTWVSDITQKSAQKVEHAGTLQQQSHSIPIRNFREPKELQQRKLQLAANNVKISNRKQPNKRNKTFIGEATRTLKAIIRKKLREKIRKSRQNGPLSKEQSRKLKKELKMKVAEISARFSKFQRERTAAIESPQVKQAVVPVTRKRNVISPRIGMHQKAISPRVKMNQDLNPPPLMININKTFSNSRKKGNVSTKHVQHIDKLTNKSQTALPQPSTLLSKSLRKHLPLSFYRRLMSDSPGILTDANNKTLKPDVLRTMHNFFQLVPHLSLRARDCGKGSSPCKLGPTTARVN